MLNSSFSLFCGLPLTFDTEAILSRGTLFAISEPKREREREGSADNQRVMRAFCSHRSISKSALARAVLHSVSQAVPSLKFHNTYKWKYPHSGYFPFAGISLPFFIYFSRYCIVAQKYFFVLNLWAMLSIKYSYIFSNFRKVFRQISYILGLNGLNTVFKEKYSAAENSAPVYRAGTAFLTLIFNTTSYLPDNGLYAVSAGWPVTASRTIRENCRICFNYELRVKNYERRSPQRS